MATNYFENLGFGADLRDSMSNLAEVGYLKQAEAQKAQEQAKAEQKALLQFQNEQQKQRAAQGAGAFYNALNSNNPQAALQIAKQYEQDIATLGDPSFTVANIAEMLKTPEGTNQLKQMAAGTVQMAAGPQEFAKYVQTQQKPMEQQKPKEFQQGTGDLAGYVFDPNTGKYQADQSIIQRIDAAKQVKAQGQTVDVKDIQSLNKDITGLVKDASMIHQTSKDISKLRNLGGGPASISIVYKFMKSLDPTSVVREGEFATAENSSGIPESVANIYNKLVSGERLPEETMKQFETTAAELANSAIDAAETNVDSYLTTFEDKLPASLSKNLRSRIPQRIELKKDPSQFLGREQQAPQAPTEYKIVEVK
jgi:hypothetical protein